MAEDVVIRAAYKAMAQKYHPDKFQGNADEASSRMSEINEAYAVLTDVELRRTYDEARKNIPPRDIVTNDAEAESSSLAIQQDGSKSISLHIPKLLVRSLVVSALLIFSGMVMNGVFSNAGGGAVIGLGLMGLAFFSLPSFVWWVARGGIKDDLLGKLLRYSFFAIPLLFMLGGWSAYSAPKENSGVVGGVTISITIAFLMLCSIFVAWLARRAYLFFTNVNVTAKADSADSDFEETEIKTGKRYDEYGNRWRLSPRGVEYRDEYGQEHMSDIPSFSHALANRRKNLFLDRKVVIEQVMSIDVTSAWILIRESFDNLKSSKNKFLSSGYESYSKQVQKESGGAEVGYQSQKLHLGNDGATGVDCIGNSTLTFFADREKVSIYPSMVIVESNNYQRVFPIEAVTVSLVIGEVVGDAPSDAKVVGQRWKYLNLSGPNKGQPDMRYKDNKKFDLYQIEWLRFSFEGRELDFGFSKAGSTERFAKHFELLKLCNRGDGNSVFKPV